MPKKMPNWLPVLAAAVAAVLLALGLWPFHARELGELLPVQVLLAERTPSGVRIETDNALSGEGETWAAALAALEAAAPGEVFYGTAGAAFLPDAALLPDVLSDTRLRPAMRVYLGAPPVAPAQAAEWAAHQRAAATLGGLRAGRDTAVPEAA